MTEPCDRSVTVGGHGHEVTGASFWSQATQQVAAQQAEQEEHEEQVAVRQAEHRKSTDGGAR
ncbi:hypothetical protein GCM10022384_54650 [Streptomyces marokkonensis]|uniref:Uncharacterized protein n=1 Tax=Streptomyces marokkonensis TaxID=324855 RepID=A0ABP7RQL3_9ACTN